MAKGRKPQSVDELKCAQIDLTDELRSMNGSIIECHYDYVDLKWTFSRVRSDLERPNVRYLPDYGMNTRLSLIIAKSWHLTITKFIHLQTI